MSWSICSTFFLLVDTLEKRRTMTSTGFGAPGDDVYKYEEEQEKKAMLKNLHLPMKSWFNALDKSFTERFGNFPSFWQDLESWEHTSVVQKLYLAAQDSGDPSGVDIFRLEARLFPRMSAEDENEGKESLVSGNTGEESVHANSEHVAKKRRNRWGEPQSVAVETVQGQESDAATSTSSSNNSSSSNNNNSDNKEASSGAQEDSAPKKRRSRFSAASSPADTVTAPDITTVAATPVPSGGGHVDAAAGLAAAAALAAKLGIGSAAGIPAGGAALKPLAKPVVTEEMMQQTLVLQMQLKAVNDRLLTVVADAAALENDPDRPPSPPPKYDSRGVRTNTREVRMREELTKERVQHIEELLRINPMYQPPPDYVRAKPCRKVYIPYKDHPTYNFIGIIIGPRGNTQKRMEQETGTKISIRGKGSVKDGSKGRSKHDGPDEDDELHVHVDGPTMEMVDKACKLIEELLVVVDDDKNEHKQKQLRELALINGTLKEDEYCSVCAEKGHRHFECPQRTKSFKAAGVKCAICGDQSHPTRDCPMKNDTPTNEVALDTEYQSFMAELGGGGKSNQQGADGGGAAVGSNGGGGGGPAGGGSTKSTEVSEDDKVKISTTSSGTGVRQTVIHVKSVLTGLSLPQSSPATANTIPLASSSFQQQQGPPGNYDPNTQQWMQQQYSAYPPHMGYQQQPGQYDAYVYPVYPSYAAPPPLPPPTSSNPDPPSSYDPYSTPFLPPSTSSFPPPPPPPASGGGGDMDMGC